MTPLTVNLTPEQSAQADAWTDGASYTLTVTQDSPGQFTATEVGPAEGMAEERPPAGEEGGAMAGAGAPARGGRRMGGGPASNPALAILIKGGGRRPPARGGY